MPFDVRVWRESRALTEAGYQVSVICPMGKGYDTGWHELREGVHIYRYPMLEAKTGLLSYLLEYGQAMVFMAFYSLYVLLRRGFDVIQLCNPPDLLIFVAAPFKLLGKKVIFDHHDLCPELLMSKPGAKEGGAVHRAMAFFERWSIRLSDVVISTNESYKRTVIERCGAKAERVFVVRNGPDLEHFQPVPANSVLRKGKKHLVFYVGNMGTQDGVDYFLRAVHHLLHKRGRDDFHVLIMGGGGELENLIEYAASLGLGEAVTFTGRVDSEDVLEGLYTADVCVSADPRNALNEVSTMNKTMEYMAVGKAQVAFDLHETRVSAGDAALYATPNDEEEFGKHLATLMDDPELRARLGDIGKRRIDEGLSWEHSKPPLLAAYACALGKAVEHKPHGQ